MRISALISNTVGLRRAAAIIFALVAVLPLLALLPLLHAAGILATTRAQVAVFLAVTLAVLGFVLLRRLTDEVAKLAAGLGLGLDRAALTRYRA